MLRKLRTSQVIFWIIRQEFRIFFQDVEIFSIFTKLNIFWASCGYSLITKSPRFETECWTMIL